MPGSDVSEMKDLAPSGKRLRGEVGWKKDVMRGPWQVTWASRGDNCPSRYFGKERRYEKPAANLATSWQDRLDYPLAAWRTDSSPANPVRTSGLHVIEPSRCRLRTGQAPVTFETELILGSCDRGLVCFAGSDVQHTTGNRFPRAGGFLMLQGEFHDSYNDTSEREHG